MAIFRIDKTQNYTVMSNQRLRNKDLTLKAKGLLSQILSLPEPSCPVLDFPTCHYSEDIITPKRICVIFSEIDEIRLLM